MATVPAASATCLNCGGPLTGPFCSSCGQRAIPANPTVAELTGDAWHELSGYDGRLLATLRGLARPGFLTREYLDGRRAHYLPPLRVYLIVSVLYFVVAAAAPTLDAGGSELVVPGVRIGLSGSSSDPMVTPQEREEIMARLNESPRLLRPVLRAVTEDPAGFRARIFTTMPRVFFAMLPVFAAIVALFFRGRTFPTSLVFAVHLHAFAFLALTITEVAKFSESVTLALAVSSVVVLVLIVYLLRAFRSVYGGGWASIVGKSAAVGMVYLIASLPAFMLTLWWAAW